jgi:hypothetical protein
MGCAIMGREQTCEGDTNAKMTPDPITDWNWRHQQHSTRFLSVLTLCSIVRTFHFRSFPACCVTNSMPITTCLASRPMEEGNLGYRTLAVAKHDPRVSRFSFVPGSRSVDFALGRESGLSVPKIQIQTGKLRRHDSTPVGRNASPRILDVVGRAFNVRV